MKSYDWIKQIPTSLLQQDAIPLTGTSPAFPWDGLATYLSKTLDLENLKIELVEKKWRTEKEFLEGMPKSLPLHLTIGQIEGSVTWLMPEDDIAALMALVLLKSANSSSVERDKEFLDGFYTFVALEALHAIKELDFPPSLAVRIKESGALPEEAALSFDVAIKTENKTFTGRLLLSPEARADWARHHTTKTPDIYFQDPLAEKVEVTLQMEAGKTSLTKEEWEAVSIGDFVLLDRCYIDPNTQKGSVLLKIHDVPYFNGKLEEGQITILEPTQTHEG